jgi:hypothetical protein
MDTLMMIWVFCIGGALGVVLGVMLSYRTAVTPLQHTVEKLTSQKQCQENMKYYPYNPGNFRFLGDPVDGIQFEDDAILFIRFKTDDTPRTPDQDRIKRLVEQKNVRWFEFMMK